MITRLRFAFFSVQNYAQAKEIGQTEHYKPIISRFAAPLCLSSSTSLSFYQGNQDSTPTLHVIGVISANALLMGRSFYATQTKFFGR